MNDKEKNLLQWIALFHDISKRGPPEFDSRDHVHPFQSGAIILNLFKEKGIIEVSEKDEILWNEMIEYINNSIEEVSPSEFPDIYYAKD